ncbi:MAG: carbon-nitrogen hydrolase [Cytophagales bacterium]|nr:carbon-nitrogen hydrolase [Cytophagales bacterium]
MGKVTIGMCQSACGPDVALNMQKTLAQVKEAADKGAQIICLQEMYRSEYFCRTEDYSCFDLAETIPGPSTDMLSSVAKEKGVVIVAPLFEKRAPGLYHNTVVVIDADGSFAGLYRKMHIPDDPSFYEKFYFTPGDLGFQVFKTRYGKIGTLICWDQWYPEAARITAMKGADIIFYPTAIGWDDTEPKEWGKHQLEAWETMQRAHAIANGCFVCAVNRVGQEGELKFWGNSFVYNPLGMLQAKTSHDKDEIACVTCDLDEIEYYRQRWPFFRDRRIDHYGDLTQRFLD